MRRKPIVLSKETLMARVGERWSGAELSKAADLLASTGGRFPPGTRSIPPGLIKDIQRERLLAGVLATVAEIGYRAYTVQAAVERAGVSRPTYYEHFPDKEASFLRAFDAAAARLRQRLEAAVDESGGDWRGRLRGGLRELLEFVGEEPDVARAVVVEARASTAEGLRHRDELLDGFASCVDSIARDGIEEQPSGIAAAGVVGGIESVLYARLQKGETDADQLEQLLPSLMYFAVLPYEGHEAALEELRGAALA